MSVSNTAVPIVSPLEDINFKVESGQTVAFVGPSGSGKTTLVKLLVGLYQPKEENVYYNCINSNELAIDDLRNQIGFVTQDTQLFSGSIRENLLFVNPNATDSEMLEKTNHGGLSYVAQQSRKRP